MATIIDNIAVFIESILPQQPERRGKFTSLLSPNSTCNNSSTYNSSNRNNINSISNSNISNGDSSSSAVLLSDLAVDRPRSALIHNGNDSEHSDACIAAHYSNSNSNNNTSSGMSSSSSSSSNSSSSSSSNNNSNNGSVDDKALSAVSKIRSASTLLKNRSIQLTSKLVHGILFDSLADRLFPSFIASIANNSFISMGVISIIYLLFLIIYYPLFICSQVVTSTGSFIMFLIGLNYLGRKVGSAMAYIGSSRSFQQDFAKEYFKRSVLMKIGGISNVLARYTTSVILALNGKMQRSEVIKIPQFSYNLIAYAEILSDYSKHVLFASDELFRSSSLSKGDSESFKQLSKALDDLSTSLYGLEPLVISSFDVKSGSITHNDSGKSLINCAGKVMREVDVLESVLKGMVPVKSDDNGDDGPIYLIKKAWSFLSSDLSLASISGNNSNNNTIASTWKYEKLSFPIIRSILFNKYKLIRVNIKGCSDNRIDGIIIPSKFSLHDVKPMNDDRNVPTFSSSSSSSTKKRSNSTTSNGMSNKFTPSPNGMVLFCNPNAAFYENLEEMVSSGAEHGWLNYYNQKLGYDFCSYNYRGYNLSEGLPRYPEDIQRDGLILAKYLIEKYNIKRLVIHGESIGGLVATYIANELSKLDVVVSSLTENEFNSKVKGPLSYSTLESVDNHSIGANGNSINNNDGNSCKRGSGDSITLDNDEEQGIYGISNQINMNSNNKSSNSSSEVIATPVVHALVCDRTFTSLDSVASRLILNKNILGRCLRYIARWETNTINNFLECSSIRKIILQDPIDEIIAYSASLQVGVAARVAIASNSGALIGGSTLSHCCLPLSSSTSLSSSSSSSSSLSSSSISPSQPLTFLNTLRTNGCLGIFRSLINSLNPFSKSQNYNYFQSIKYLPTQYNINHYCGFDLPYRDEEDSLLLSLKNNIHDFTLNDRFIDHFTACLRHLFICSQYEKAIIARNNAINNSSKHTTEGQKSANSGIVGCHQGHPTAEWIKSFCNNNILRDISTTSTSSTSPLNSPSASRSSSRSQSKEKLFSNPDLNDGIFQRIWVAVGRINGGTGQLLGQSLGTCPISFEEAICGAAVDPADDSRGSRSRISNSNSGGSGGGRSSAVSDDDSGDDRTVSLNNSFGDDDIESGGGTSYDDVAGSVLKGSSSDRKLFFHGREKDSVAAWLSSVVVFGNSNCGGSERVSSDITSGNESSGSNDSNTIMKSNRSMSTPAFFDKSMPKSSRGIDDALGDLDVLINTLKEFYDLTSPIPILSSIDSQCAGGSTANPSPETIDLGKGMTENKKKLFLLYRNTIATSRTNRKSLNLSSTNSHNYNIRAGYYYPVVDTCSDSVKFIRNGLAIIRDHLLLKKGTSLKSDRLGSIDEDDYSCMGCRYTPSNMNIDADNNINDDSLPFLPRNKSAVSKSFNGSELNRGVLISLHTGHNGWPTLDNLNDLTSILNS